MTATVTIQASHKRVKLTKVASNGDQEEVILDPHQTATVYVSNDRAIGDIIELDE
jgi:hypothetical protein